METPQIQFTESVPVLMLPSRQGLLVVPSVNVAEFITLERVDPLVGTPDWFMGMISWRGQRIPLISFEQLNGETTFSPAKQMAVLNGISGRDDLPFYAVQCAGLPRQTKITSDDIVSSDGELLGPVELSRVKLSGELCAIPDLDALESKVSNVMRSLR